MPKRRTFTPKFKAQVVLEELTGVKDKAEICREHRLRPQVFTRWKTEGVKPRFDKSFFRFWAGILDCNSARPPDKPYRIEATLYKEGKIQEHTEISFLVVDDPFCGSSP